MVHGLRVAALVFEAVTISRHVDSSSLAVIDEWTLCGIICLIRSSADEDRVTQVVTSWLWVSADVMVRALIQAPGILVPKLHPDSDK